MAKKETATQVRLQNGTIVDVPYFEPERLLMAMEFSPPETEVETIKDDNVAQPVQLAQIAMVCVCPRSTDFKFVTEQTMCIVNHLKRNTHANHQVRTERAQNSLYSIPSPPPPNCPAPPFKP